jgi:hypothetical protein
MVMQWILPFLLVLCLVLLAPSLEGSLGDARLAIPPTSLLTLVFLQQTYKAEMPPTAYLTFLDVLYAYGYALSVGLFVLFLWGSNQLEAADDGQRERLMRRINRVDLRCQIGGVLGLALVAVSLMFPPGETLEGPAGDAQATAQCRLALMGLAQACRAAGHRPWIGVPSAQQGALLAPLLAAAGLPAGEVHPAVVGAGGAVPLPASGGVPAAAVLLHWGDLKRGKGRQEALAVVAALLEQGVPPELASLGWLFHLHSREPLPAAERALLERARQKIRGFTLLEGPMPRAEMLERLAGCPLALLAYDPRTYAQRSSGMLWTWASARLAAGQPAAAVGYGEGWLAAEAPALGVSWRALAAGERTTSGGEWLGLLRQSLSALDNTSGFTPYGRSVLGRSFAAHLVSTVLASDP